MMLAGEYLSFGIDDEDDIGLGNEEIHFGGPDNVKYKAKLQPSFGYDQIGQEEHQDQREREYLDKDLKNKLKSRDPSDNLEDVRNEKDRTMAPLENLVNIKTPLGNDRDQHIVMGQTGSPSVNHEDQINNRQDHEQRSGDVENQHENHSLLRASNNISLSSRTGRLERDVESQYETVIPRNNHQPSSVREFFKSQKVLIFFGIGIAIILGVASLAVTLSNQRDVKTTESTTAPPLPVYHHASAHVALVAPPEGEEKNDTVLFLNDKDNVSSSSVQHLENVTLLGFYLEILQAGAYEVYNSIQIILRVNETCTHFENETLKSNVWRTNSEDLSIRDILFSTSYNCHDIGDQKYISGVFKLNVGDRVHVTWSTKKIPIYFNERSSFLGLILRYVK